MNNSLHLLHGKIKSYQDEFPSFIDTNKFDLTTNVASLLTDDHNFLETILQHKKP
jgi:hypothetical protein